MAFKLSRSIPAKCLQKTRIQSKKRVGTIVKQVPREGKVPIFYVAEGSWLEKFDGRKNSYKSDPTNQEQTGASFAKGNFYKLSQDLDHFVVGAPNANNMKGRVYICHDCFGTQSKEHGRELVASQSQIGERFGATVAAVDINGDGLDDVVVGAPFHSIEGKVDLGRIVIFQNLVQGGDNQFHETVEVSPNELNKGSRFGFSIANIGDIHKDGFQDFAVGAPMGGVDGTGLVFIFHGCEDFNFGKKKILKQVPYLKVM